MNRSGVSGLLFVFMLFGLALTMYYEHRHLSNSCEDRRLHLARSLRQANMPAEQASALLEAIDGAGQDAHSALMAVFIPMIALIPMAFADIYENHRRLKRLESKLQQSSPALQPGGG